LVTGILACKPAATEAMERYQALARQHYENFPVGSLLLPARTRRHLRRIYAFARIADDLADEQRDAAALAALRADFLAHLDGRSSSVPLLVDLAASIRELELPAALFTDLLDAFEQDLRVLRYDDEAQLLDYCRRSANPVGRLVLRVCGHRDERLDLLSDRICTALQLLNHLQDLGDDLRTRGRIYYPRTDLARFGVDAAALLAPAANSSVRALVRHWAGRLGGDFAAGWPLTRAVRGRLRCELRAILHGAAAVLARLCRAGYDPLAHRVRLSMSERLRCLASGLLSRRPPRFVEAP
jgi:squalene synthase HpnC